MKCLNEFRGNALVGQSGGPTAAINATLVGVIRGCLAEQNGDGRIGHLYGMRYGVDGYLQGHSVDLSGLFPAGDPATGTALDTLTATPSAALGSCRRKLPATGTAEEKAVMEPLFSRLAAQNIRYFFYIGGNDSMDTVAKVSSYAETVGYPLRVIGVPKTIDNDLVGTDHTPGYGSAAKYIAVTVQEILRDMAVYTLPSVTVVEIMGRDAGWLTAASALGRSVTGQEPDYVYLPERFFSCEAFLEDVRRALNRHASVTIAVSEGLRLKDGSYVGEGTTGRKTDAFGHKALAGTAVALGQLIKEQIGCKVRAFELNLPQRCAGHMLSSQDIQESLTVGETAVSAALSGISREMMTIDRIGDHPYAYRVGHRDVGEIANQVRRVPESFINEDGNHVTDACLDYLLPLIHGEHFPVYENGLPKQWILPE